MPTRENMNQVIQNLKKKELNFLLNHENGL